MKPEYIFVSAAVYRVFRQSVLKLGRKRVYRSGGKNRRKRIKWVRRV